MVVFLLTLSLAATTHLTTGLSYDGKTPVFTLQKQTVEDGSHVHLHVVHRYVDPARAKAEGLSDDIATIEDVEVDNGQLVHYALDQHQTRQQGVVDVKNGHVTYTLTTAGKTKADTKDLPANLAVAPTAAIVLHQLWPKIFAGETVSISLGLVEELDQFGFHLSKGETKADDVFVAMKPLNVFAVFFIKSLYFHIRPNGEVISYHGPITPQRYHAGAKWDVFVADTYYHDGN